MADKIKKKAKKDVSKKPLGIEGTTSQTIEGPEIDNYTRRVVKSEYNKYPLD